MAGGKDNYERNLIEVHVESVNRRLDRVDTLMGKLFDKLDENSQILAKLTVIVDEHHKRSTTLEKLFNTLKENFDLAEKKLITLDRDIRDLNEELDPVKVHVDKVSKTFNFLTGVPTVVKGIAIVFTLISSGFGLYKMIVEIFVK